LPFPDTENHVDAGLLNGDYRPEHDIPGVSRKVLDAATPDIPVLQYVLTLSARTPALPKRIGNDRNAAITVVHISLAHITTPPLSTIHRLEKPKKTGSEWLS